MIKKLVIFLTSFLATFALFYFTSDSKEVWEFILQGLVGAVVSTLISDSKFFSRAIERAVKPFSQKP